MRKTGLCILKNFLPSGKSLLNTLDWKAIPQEKKQTFGRIFEVTWVPSRKTFEYIILVQRFSNLSIASRMTWRAY